MTATLNSTGVLYGDSTQQNTAFIGGRGQVFTANGTFTVPTGVTAVKVTVVGGGGGSGGAQDGSCYTGYGGPGGGVAVAKNRKQRADHVGQRCDRFRHGVRGKV